jgi:hypothetical protein
MAKKDNGQEEKIILMVLNPLIAGIEAILQSTLE